MIDYANLLGGLITSEFPYLIMIFCGYFFARYDILKRDGLHTLSKLMIEIFIPIFLFINVCRSTSAATIQKNFLIILSTLFYILFAGGIAYIYTFLTKMDVRYRYTWIFMIAIVDVKLLHRLIVNTFCFHIKDMSQIETEFCNDITTYNYVHMFFQGLFTWYVAFNLIRQDRIKAEKIGMVLYKLNKKNEKHGDIKELNLSDDNNRFEINSVEDEEKLKEIVEKSSLRVKVSSDVMKQIETYVKTSKEKKWYRETIYIMLRPPLIGMFTGFVVGYITEIQAWLFNTKTAVFVKYFFNH